MRPPPRSTPPPGSRAVRPGPTPRPPGKPGPTPRPPGKPGPTPRPPVQQVSRQPALACWHRWSSSTGCEPQAPVDQRAPTCG
ncbi:hypothetical protein GSF22_19700 [Micromonospora echinofusca]|uniref:Uncharacterized protein n=1 Tax=Micromonospora echinofusca TaxID=47858 RepID=A0ABS3VUP4_MICEH|nr:hypothetical protein [Micromonospora echinofusca]